MSGGVSRVLLQDYDGDGVSDCVGVHVAGVGVIRSRSSASNILDMAASNLTNLTSHAYLNTWARYQLDGYCLAVLFSSKVRHVCPLELQPGEGRSRGLLRDYEPYVDLRLKLYSVHCHM